MREYKFCYENSFIDETLTIENYKEVGKKKIIFFDKEGNVRSKAEIIKLLAADIHKKEKSFRYHIGEAGSNTRDKNGKFTEGNTRAQKFIYTEKEIYLLYLLCGSSDATGDALGVCRQTISRIIRSYK